MFFSGLRLVVKLLNAIIPASQVTVVFSHAYPLMFKIPSSPNYSVIPWEIKPFTLYVTEITELVKEVKWWPLCICYWWFYTFFPPGNSTFTRITTFFAQLWIHSTATYCPTPVFTTTTTAHTTASTGSKFKQTSTSNPALQRIDPSRNSAQHDSCDWKGICMDKFAIQKWIGSMAICYSVEPTWQPVMTLAFKKHTLTLKVRVGKTGKPAKISPLVTVA